MDKTEALRLVAAAAVESEHYTGCPAELTAAQAIIESAWLAHAPGNNCFGIKAGAGQAAQVLQTTEWFTEAQLQNFLIANSWRKLVRKTGAAHGDVQECIVLDTFRLYGSLAECFSDHARLITNGKPYAAAWRTWSQTHDLEPFVRGVAARYATDPHYAQALLAIIGQANVKAALAEARHGKAA